MQRIVLVLLLGLLCRMADAATELAVALGANGDGTVVLRLNRMLALSDGRLAILVGDVDATALFRVTPLTWTLETAVPALPAGTVPIRVFLVALDGEWRELQAFTATVREAAAESSGAHSDTAIPSDTALRSASALKLQPSLALAYKSQHYSRAFPAETAPPRPTFDDGTLQGSLTSAWQGTGKALNTNWSIAGATAAAETLRFAEQGATAPHVDLSSYLVDFQWKGANMQVGHVQAGSSRHLIDSFASRGVRVAVPLGKRADVALAQVNGTQIVGWDNFFGLNRRTHQIGSATLGLELLPRAGGLRLELAALTGSLLPLTAFTQGALTDAEKSTGGSIRLKAADPSERFRFDGALTRSSFTNPADSTLIAPDESGMPVNIVAVRRETRGAYYADAAADLIRNAFAQSSTPVTVTLNYRGERVDPQFRSVAAQSQADRLQNQLELATSAGPITGSASYLRSIDNLLGLAALMRTSTRQSAVNVAMPVSAFWSKPASFARWLPQITYALLDMHQFGTGNPLGFDSPSQLPNQKNINHNATLDWTVSSWRVGYRFNRSEQDNRQPGRERADLINTVNSASLGWTAGGYTTAFEAGIEDVFSKELARTDRTIRIATNNTWIVRRGLTLLVNLSLTRLNQMGTISATRALEGDVQFTWDLARENGPWSRARPQLLFRYANRYQSVFDGVFLLDAITRAQSIQMGITLTLQ